MGLKEKRAIKDFEENQFPVLKQRIFDSLGFDVDIEVKWESIAKNLKLNIYEEALPNVYFEPVIQSFQEICSDDMGKEALQEVLKKIVFQDENDIFSASQWMKFDDGVLILDHESCVNHGNVEDRKSYLNEMLEEIL